MVYLRLKPSGRRRQSHGGTGSAAGAKGGIARQHRRGSGGAERGTPGEACGPVAGCDDAGAAGLTDAVGHGAGGGGDDSQGGKLDDLCWAHSFGGVGLGSGDECPWLMDFVLLSEERVVGMSGCEWRRLLKRLLTAFWDFIMEETSGGVMYGGRSTAAWLVRDQAGVTSCLAA
ncbi:hypothetical protein VDGL01_04352 [Verticillium dahliae]